MSEHDHHPKLSWLNTSFLAIVHLAGIGGTVAYLLGRGPEHSYLPSAAAVGTFFAWSALTIFAISAGYHRLFAHKAYEAHPVLRFFLLAFGAASCQNSVLNWAADHRRHHKRTDTAADPYNALRGFWHSHVGWVLEVTPAATEQHPVPDLEKDPLVMLQHRYYPVFGFLVGFVAPTLVGWAFGDAWGGFLFGVLLRLVFVYHVTFSINSFAHMLGTQPYSDRSSARDSFICAMLSMGEGYHNFHHTFPADYRNGVRAHQFDPSKWMLRLLEMVGLARNLKRTSEAVILRARLRMQARGLEAQASSPMRERLTQLKARMEEYLQQWHAVITRMEEARAERKRELLRRLQPEVRRLKNAFRSLERDWQDLKRSIELGSTATGL